MSDFIDQVGVRTRLSVGRQLRPFAAISLLAAAFILFATWPAAQTQALVTSGNYSSHASLLLPPEARFAFARVFVSTSRSDLDMWLSNQNLFRQFLDRRKIAQKAREKIARSHPELVGLCGMANAQLGQSNGGQRMTADQAFQEEQKQEMDYVQNGDQAEDGQRVSRRANRIFIQATGSSPEGSLLLAKTYTEVLQKELEEVATRRVRTQKDSIEKYLRIGKVKARLAENRLQRWKTLEPQTVQQQQERIQSLRREEDRLRGDVLRIEQQIKFQTENEEVRAALATNPVRRGLDELQQKLRLAEKTFLPASSTVTTLKERISFLQRLASRLESEQAAKETSVLSQELEIRSRRLAETRQEIQSRQQNLPKLKAVQKFATQERELAAWTTEQLSWEQQLLQARIEERLCKGEGTAVLLQSAQPGIKEHFVGIGFLTTWHRSLRLLPMAPLVGLICVCLWQLVHSANQIRRKAEYFIDAPVLGELPRFRNQYEKSWLQLKYKGRQSLNENPLE